MMTTSETEKTAYSILQARVEKLAAELPGITFGYIGNVGVDRNGPYDDRSWAIFLPHPGRVGTIADRVTLGATSQLAIAVNQWDAMEAQARRLYAKGGR